MLRSRLDDIARDLPETLDRSMRETAEFVEAGAKARVSRRTGLLASQIHVEKDGEARYSVVAGNAQAFYGGLLEAGHEGVEPHPFLVPALDGALEFFEARARAAMEDM